MRPTGTYLINVKRSERSISSGAKAQFFLAFDVGAKASTPKAPFMRWLLVVGRAAYYSQPCEARNITPKSTRRKDSLKVAPGGAGDEGSLLAAECRNPSKIRIN